MFYSSMYAVDPVLVQAVVQAESKGEFAKIGPFGERGYMQLRPEYFGPDVFNPRKNIEMGVKYLGELQHTCKHKEDYTFVVCFNTGQTGGDKIKNPKQFPYYLKVMAEYNKLIREQ